MNGMDADLIQEQRGFAWHYKAYELKQPAIVRKVYADAEIEARAALRGLWAGLEPVQLGNSDTRESESKLTMNYRHPWNIVTLLIGVALLIAGSFWYEALDWDIPISLIMAGFSYLTAAWSLRVLVARDWKNFPLMLFFTWWTVDGCYAIYWHFQNPMALELMREANWPASLALYWTCGLVWSVPELLKKSRHV